MKRTTRNIIIKLSYLVLLGLFMTLAVSAKIARENQPVSDVRITIDHTSGNFFISEADVEAAIRDMLPDSGSVLQVKDLKILEEKIAGMPVVGRSNVFVDNSGHLSIDIRQRMPLYRIFRPDGSTCYVDEEGIKFPVSRRYSARVPVVTGHVTDNGANSGPAESGLHGELAILFRTLAADPFWEAQITQVDVTASGEFELVPRIGDHIIQIGTTEALEDKLMRLQALYREGLPRVGWDAYSVINVKFRDQVICKRKG